MRTIRDDLKTVYQSNQGFTLAEMMITMTIIGVIAVMMIQMVFANTNNAGSLSRVKDISQQIQRAASTLQDINPTIATPTGIQVANLMNYVSTTTNAGDDTLITGFTSTSTIRCSQGGFQCYRFSNESVILTSTTQRADGLTLFIIDPDGRSNRAPVVLVYQHSNGRLTTKAAYESDTATTLANSTNLADPDYAREWSKL
jgi:prepilin-type N-terminal cleavage/methylation domain-containing protein